jgi:hypothetical protein
MAKMGDWRNDKDEEIALDGIGGVNILVKADVHRSGKQKSGATVRYLLFSNTVFFRLRHQLPMLCLREPGRNRGLRQDGQACRLRGVRSAQLRRLAH